jgi:hypothetical protein
VGTQQSRADRVQGLFAVEKARLYTCEKYLKAEGHFVQYRDRFALYREVIFAWHHKKELQ